MFCRFVKVQNAKQVNSALKQKMEGGIEEFKPPEVWSEMHVIERLCFGVPQSQGSVLVPLEGLTM